MIDNEQPIVQLKAEFYRDGFPKVLLALAMTIAAIGSLAGLSVYLYLSKPDPVYFYTDSEWRILPAVPLNQPYLSNADLLQWLGKTISDAFSYDFLNYQQEQQDLADDFTTKGWQNLQGQLNNYHLDYDSLRNSRAFVNTKLTGAPFILNQGLLPEGKYAWRVQIPVNVSYSSGVTRSLVIIALVVRIPTLNNLYGVAVDDMSITEAQGSQVKTNGG